MAKFFVGQRVRVVRIFNAENAYLLGLEGRVTQKQEDIRGDTGYGLDISPIALVCRYGTWKLSAFHGDQLEPVSPEGQQPCGESYEQLMDRLRAGVVA